MDKNELTKVVLERQVDAFVRCCYLLGEKTPKNYSIDEIANELANAEIDAQFIYGFEMLNQSSDVKEEIASYMKEIDCIAIRGDNSIILTDKGLERAQIKLPEQIENYFSRSNKSLLARIKSYFF